jgi:hypothetical protein
MGSRIINSTLWSRVNGLRFRVYMYEFRVLASRLRFHDFRL